MPKTPTIIVLIEGGEEKKLYTVGWVLKTGDENIRDKRNFYFYVVWNKYRQNNKNILHRYIEV